MKLIDWRALRRRLMHGGMKLRPWEIDRMGMDELVLALDEPDGKRRAPSGAADLGSQGVIEYAARFRAMTPAQRLDAALEEIVR